MFNKIFNDFVREVRSGEHSFLKFGEIKIDEITKFVKNIHNKYNYVAIIGFGASSLNIRAISSAISKPIKKTIYLDSLDEVDIEDKLESIDIKQTIFFVLSKSGNTNETYLLTKYILEIKKVSNEDIYIIAPSNNNLLSNLAKDCHISLIEHEQHISGRFGIISSATLLPCAVIGVDLKVFISSALKALANTIANEQNIINIAKYYLDNYSLGRKILVTFNYCHQLDGLCRWQQQLIGESLGKGNFGITPILSTGTFDEHSQLQLYLEGPSDKFFKIIMHERNDTLLNHNLSTHAHNVHTALISNNRPVSLENFTYINEEIIVNQIIESIFVIIMIAKHERFNPFNQLSVDSCKAGYVATT